MLVAPDRVEQENRSKMLFSVPPDKI